MRYAQAGIDMKHGKGCPYCGRLALAELVRNPAPDQA